jgi:sodium/pantothenate symporter
VLLAMIQVPTIWLSLGILGKKFAILARRYNAITLNDMLLARYQSRTVVWVASISLLVAFVGAMPCNLSAVLACWKPLPVFSMNQGC